MAEAKQGEKWEMGGGRCEGCGAEVEGGKCKVKGAANLGGRWIVAG